jgi:hypothetical protein
VVADELSRLRRDYVPLLLRYLAKEDEVGLQSAYELGREAMRHSVGLLELVRIHNDTLVEVISTVRGAEEATEVVRAASTFLMELIAPFEIAQRGFMDVGLRGGEEGELR